MPEFTEMQAHAWAEIVDKMYADPQFAIINGASLNGPGSSLEFTTALRVALPELLQRYRVATMLDAPCGDWTWMQRTDLTFLYSYIGMDCNARLISRNQTKYRQWRNLTFMQANLLTKKRFPRVDLILCRDFLAHLPNEWISSVLDRFKLSGSTYLLASNYPGADNDFSYDPETTESPWLGYMERQHDLSNPPFSLHRIDGIPEKPAPGGVIANPHELGLFELKE